MYRGCVLAALARVWFQPEAVKKTLSPCFLSLFACAVKKTPWKIATNVDVIDWNVQIQHADTFNANIYSGDWAGKKKKKKKKKNPTGNNVIMKFENICNVSSPLLSSVDFLKQSPLTVSYSQSHMPLQRALHLMSSPCFVCPHITIMLLMKTLRTNCLWCIMHQTCFSQMVTVHKQLILSPKNFLKSLVSKHVRSLPQCKPDWGQRGALHFYNCWNTECHLSGSKSLLCHYYSDCCKAQDFVRLDKLYCLIGRAGCHINWGQ